MPRSWIYALALLLLSFVAALFFWPEGDAPQGEEPAAGSTSAPHLNGNEEPALAPRAKVAGDSGNSGRTEQVASLAPLELPDPEPQYEGSDGITITALQHGSQEPVAAADIYIMDRLELYRVQRKLERTDPGRSWINLLRKYGKHYRSNELGTVRIPPLETTSVAMAEKGGWFGILDQLSTNLDQADILLRLDRKLTVNVVDAAGLGVPDAMVTIQTAVRSYGYTRKTRYTDAHGAVTIEGLCVLIDHSQGPQKFFARLEVPVNLSDDLELQRVELTDDIFETGKITFTMPATGGVRISVYNQNGELSKVPGYIGLSLAERIGGSPNAFWVNAEVIDGIAEFPFVGLRTSLNAEYTVKGSSNEDSISLPGPQQAGDWIDASITATDWPFLIGRLILPDGTVLADADAMLNMDNRFQSNGYRSESQLRTDSNGGFRYVIPQLAPGLELISRKGSFSAEREGLGKCEATLEIPVDLLPGENDLGDLTLQAARLLLSGIVLDSDGIPISKAAVTILSKSTAKYRSESWHRTQKDKSVSERDGSFVIQGEVPSESTYQVAIEADGYQALKQDIALGLDGIEFRLEKAGVLLGSVLIDEGIDFNQLGFTMRSPDRREGVRLQASEDQSLLELRFEGNTNTPYTLTARTRPGESFLTLENILLPPGGEIRPPELQPLDLRGKFKQIKLIVQDQQGQRIKANVTTIKENESGSTSSSSTSTGGGEVTLLSMAPFQKITIDAKGYNPKTILDVTTDQIITLERAIEAFAKLPVEFLDYRGMEVRLEVSSKQSKTRLRVESFDKSGQAKFFLPSLDVYEFHLVVLKKEGAMRFGDSMQIGDFAVEHEGQIISLMIDLAELDRLVDKLQENQ